MGHERQGAKWPRAAAFLIHSHVMGRVFSIRNICFFHALTLLFCESVTAQEKPAPPSQYMPPQQGLFAQQRDVAERFGQLEQILLRMSEASATSNPRRAELLKKTLLASKDKLIALRLESLVDILQNRRLTEAVAGQEGVENDLLALLKLLESENREQRRAQEKEEIKKFLRDLEEIIHQEKALKARTTRWEKEPLSPEKLSAMEKEQRDVRLNALSLQNRMADVLKESSAEEPHGSPARQAMEKAQNRMRQAEEKLQKAVKDGVLEDQEEAIAELQKAKAELEKILRQIREEELLQTLENLESRLERMLHAEQSIRSKTEQMCVTSKEADDVLRRQIRIQADQLATEQLRVLGDADAALVLLREDGTAQAMVELLLQTRFDMDEIRQRLEGAVLDAMTLDIEDAVVAALEEMLSAVKQAIQEAKARQDDLTENPQRADPRNGDAPGDEPLVQMLAELKIIRSMQQRVNERTQRCEAEMATLQNEPDADYGPLRKRVEELARQQNRISRILHDLKVGKTQ